MKLKKTAAVYSIIVGCVMIGMWIMYLLTGQVPELKTTPIQIIPPHARVSQVMLRRWFVPVSGSSTCRVMDLFF